MHVCLMLSAGNVALSVMMTTITTLGAIVMTPLLCKLLLGAVVPVDAVGIAVSTVQVCITKRCIALPNAYMHGKARL